MKRFIGLVALVAALAAGAVPSRADVVIDDFRSTSYPYPTPTGLLQGAVGYSTITESGLAGADTIGGARTVTIAVSSAASMGDFANVRVGGSPSASTGSLSYASTTGADGSLTLSYGLGGPGLDADLSGMGSIDVGLLDFDRANGLAMPVTLRLVDMDGVESELTVDVTSAGAQTLSFSLAEFSSLDLSRIRGIELTFEAALSSDFRLSSIRAVVPEPPGLALLGVGMAGLAGFSWRRRLRSPR